MKKLSKSIRHNQGLFAAALLGIILPLWTFGCESKIGSLVEPAKLVSRAELQLEIEQLSAQFENELVLLAKQAELKFTQLDRRDRIKRQLLEFGLLAAETGSVNPAGLIGLLAGVFGIGIAIDNRIKDKVIKTKDKELNRGKVQGA